MEEKKPDHSKLMLILIFVLFITNVYLGVMYSHSRNTTKIMYVQSNMDSSKLADLDIKYNGLLDNIEAMRGQNASLDSLLDIKEIEIKTMKSDLDAARKSGKLKDSEYFAKLDALHILVDDLRNQIVKLEDERNILILEKGMLGEDLNAEVDKNVKLNSDNKVLGTKAGLLKAFNIIGTGARGRGQGKEVSTNNAKKTERIKVCFTIDDNKYVISGNKTFLLQITTPNGTIIGVDKFVQENGKESIYTAKQTVRYEQKSQNICIYWGNIDSIFAQGQYTIELYQDGYSVGKNQFILK